uniref:Uncharacterized protein n=1 Tax=Setaria viridis TaxID=4556 RepID=A0A4U6SZH1_SETVI|nr:hypothetical protein SEVIR_9G246600v2 [Setaria viridis]
MGGEQGEAKRRGSRGWRRHSCFCSEITLDANGGSTAGRCTSRAQLVHRWRGRHDRSGSRAPNGRSSAIGVTTRSGVVAWTRGRRPVAHAVVFVKREVHG